MRGLVISAPASGSGKTTVTLGLLGALRRRGLPVVSAKSGPDYIDPAFHEAATGQPCVTLDAWAAPAGQLRARAVRRRGRAVHIGCVRQDGVEIAAFCHPRRRPADEGLQIGPLARLHQSEMPRRQRQIVAPGQRAQHRQHGLDSAAYDRLVPGAAEPVQDHPGDMDVRAEPGDPGRHRRRPLAHPRHIHDQHHRQAQRRGDIGRRA